MMIKRHRNMSCCSLNSNSALPPNPRRLSRRISSNVKNGLIRNGSEYLKNLGALDDR
jgi:hypothetical protein